MPQSRFRKTMRFAIAIACVALLTFECESAWSQRRSTSRSTATAVMGRGIHSYFSGQSAEAERQLSAVINAGSRDPRAYYFRGLARLQQGRQYEAEQDMQLGAALESRNPGSARGISRALMRVQGANRRTLEKIRREGRLAAATTIDHESQARSQRMQSRESFVLRKPVQVPVEQLLESSGVEIIVPDAQVVQGSYVESAPIESVPATSPLKPQEAVVEIPVQVTEAPAEKVVPAETMPVEAAPSTAVATPQPELAAESSEPDPGAVDDFFATPDEPKETPEASTPEPADDFFAEESSEPAVPAEEEMETESPEVASEASDELFGDESASSEASTDPLFTEPSESPEPVEPEMEAETEEAGDADDLFGLESEEATQEESTTESFPEADSLEPEEEMLEEAATDDLFGVDDSTAEEPASETASIEEAPLEEAPAEKSSLPEESKVGSQKLLGILGRAAGGMVPKPDVSIPEIVPPLGPGEATPPAAAEAFDLGPEEAFSPAGELPPAPADLPAPSEETPAPVDDLFGLDEEEAPMKGDQQEPIDLFDEPSGPPAEEPAEEEPKAEESESPESESEDREDSGEQGSPAEETAAAEITETKEEASEEEVSEEDSSEEDAPAEKEDEESTEEDEESEDPFDLFD